MKALVGAFNQEKAGPSRGLLRYCTTTLQHYPAHFQVNFTAESSHTLVAERGLYKLYNCGGSTVSLASVVALPRASTHPWHTGLLQGGGEEALAAHINLVQNHCRHLGKSL